MSNALDSGGAVDIPWDDDVVVIREAVLDAGDVDGVGFVVWERELEDAVGLNGVVEGSAIWGDPDDAAERVFDGTVYSCEVEGEA